MKKLRVLDLAPAIIWGMQNPKIRKDLGYPSTVWDTPGGPASLWEPSLIDSAGDRILTVLADPYRAERINVAVERHVR